MTFIGIGGGTCSGKTTLVRRLSERLGGGCACIGLDSYYLPLDLPFAQRARVNHDLPEQFDWPLLRAHLKTLRSGHAINMPVYDFPACNRSERTQRLEPAPVIFLEGIHAFFDPAIRAAMDLRIFMTATPVQRRERRLARDLAERYSDREFIIAKFENQTEIAYAAYVEPQQVFADHVCASMDEAEAVIHTFLGMQSRR